MREESLFVAALDLPSAAARKAFLDRECGGDVVLRARVERLLAADVQSTGILDAGADTDGPAAHPLRVGPRLSPGSAFAGRYVLARKLGAGGMGEVWAADQTLPVRRPVAVKVIRPGLDPAALLARFDQERQALALMDHPHIAKVFDAGVADGLPYLAMELVDGKTVTAYCDARQLSVRQRLELFVPVCQAVQHAHQKGVIHRDLKPSNVLVAEVDGKPAPKVIDFGIAKAAGAKLADDTVRTGYGAVLGTPEYMAPEQAAGDADVDTRADVYALGVVLYELLTGTTPIRRTEAGAGGLLDLLRAIREVNPPTPSRRLAETRGAGSAVGTPRPAFRAPHFEALDWVVMRCLEKDRARRYESAAALARDVERFLADEVVEARPPSAAYRARTFVRRNRLQVAAAAAVLVAVAAGGAAAAWQAVRATAAEGRAVADRDAKEDARRAEAARAGGEKRAKEEAEREKARAVAAADAAKAATAQAHKRLGQIERGNELLVSVFQDLDPQAEEKEGRPLRAILADRLAAAADRLDGEAVGDPLAVSKVQNQLGLSLVSLGFAARAVPLFEKSRATARAAAGPDHPPAMVVQNNLAQAYLEAGRPADAVPLLEECLRWDRGAHGPDHPAAVRSLNNLASAYVLAGRPSDAVPLLEECLPRARRAFGPDHPLALKTLNNLGMAYLGAGRPADAVPLHEECLRLRTGTLGPHHIDTIESLSNLGRSYRRAGRVDKALPLFEEAYPLARARLGASHPVALTAMTNLAGGYRGSGQPGKALPLYEECLRLSRARLGPDHRDTLTVLNNLALAYLTDGRSADAVPLFEECLRGQTAGLGRNHPATLTAQMNLVVAYLEVGRAGEALPLFEEFLARRRGQPGAGTPEFAGQLATVSTALIQAGQFAAAEPYLRECLALRAKAEPDAWATANTRSLLGGALLGQGKPAEAEPLLVTGYAGLKERAKTVPPAVRVRLPEAADRLVELYEGLGKPDEVRRWRAERARYPFVAPPPRPARSAAAAPGSGRP